MKSYPVREAFALFYNLIALSLGKNSVKSLRVKNILKGNNVGAIEDKLESKKVFPETSSYKISETNFSFNVKEHTTGKV